MGKKINNVFDPFLEIAQGISSSKDGNVFEEEPVNIVEFIESKKFLNQKWNGRVGCRPKIMEIAIEVVKPNIREVILLLGKGSGKDYISSIIHLYGIYRCLCLINPQQYFGLAPGPIYFVNTARNETQSKKVFFSQFISLLNNCPWFSGKYRDPGTQVVQFQKNIQALSANSQAYSWLGFNTIQWVGDELAFFLETDKNDDDSIASRSQECWESAFGSCKTRFPTDYKMIGITTPRYDDDFVMKKFYELKDRIDGYTIQAATWDINPLLKKEDFKYEFIKDYRRTMRDFGAEPSGVIESFWSDPKMIEEFVCETCRQCPVYQKRSLNENYYECWDYENCTANAYAGNGKWRSWFKPPVENNAYAMHFDLSKNKDRLGFCLGRVTDMVEIELDIYKLKERGVEEGELNNLPKDERFEQKPLIKIEALGFVATNPMEWHRNLLKNKEFYYSAILNNIVVWLLEKGFNIEIITFDQFQSHFFKQEVEDRGVETELISLDRTDEIPVAAKYAVAEHRVEYPFSYLLAEEAKHLKYMHGKKVDHIRGFSKDVFDAFAGTIWNCEKYLELTSSFVMVRDNDDD